MHWLLFLDKCISDDKKVNKGWLDSFFLKKKIYYMFPLCSSFMLFECDTNCGIYEVLNLYNALVLNFCGLEVGLVGLSAEALGALECKLCLI